MLFRPAAGDPQKQTHRVAAAQGQAVAGSRGKTAKGSARGFGRTKISSRAVTDARVTRSLSSASNVSRAACVTVPTARCWMNIPCPRRSTIGKGATATTTRCWSRCAWTKNSAPDDAGRNPLVNERPDYNRIFRCHWRFVVIPTTGEFRPSAIECLGNNRVLILERDFGRLLGRAGALRSATLVGDGGDSLAAVETVALRNTAQGYQIDNFEGLARHKEIVSSWSAITTTCLCSGRCCSTSN